MPLKQNPLPLYISGAGDDQAEDGQDPMLQGSVSITYEVSTRGRATGLKLMEAVPPEFEDMVNYVQREVRRRIYRPRLEDGEVVATPDLVLVHRYYYRQSDLEAARAVIDANSR